MGGVHRTETPLTAVAPHCPVCGRAVMFMRREDFQGEVLPVECSCGWKGQSPKAVPLHFAHDWRTFAQDGPVFYETHVRELQAARNRLESALNDVVARRASEYNYWTERIAATQGTNEIE